MKMKPAHTVFVLACALAFVVGAAGCGGGGSSTGEATPPPASTAITPGAVVGRQLTFSGSVYPYYLYVPHSYDGSHAMPSVLMLHGAGGNGADFIKTWENQAEKSGLLLVAPTVPGTPQYEAQSPALFRALMEAAKTEVKVDPKRMYLFGHSNGGYATFYSAMFDSDYFAGAGVFAGIITPDYDWIVSHAQRKTAFAIYIGDSDPFFTLAQTRRTRDLLLTHGFPVHYVELAHTDHNYPAVADTVNVDAWQYLSQYSLP